MIKTTIQKTEYTFNNQIRKLNLLSKTDISVLKLFFENYENW